MRPSWRKIVATATVMGGLMAVGSLEANAANFSNDCGSNYLCLYNQASFQDQLAHKASGFAQTNLPPTDRGLMSSWQNHSTKTGAWWDVGVGTPFGDCFVMDSQTVNGSVGPLWQDSAISWQGNHGC